MFIEGLGMHMESIVFLTLYYQNLDTICDSIIGIMLYFGVDIH